VVARTGAAEDCDVDLTATVQKLGEVEALRKRADMCDVRWYVTPAVTTVGP
jgi:hypothetical protein